MQRVHKTINTKSRRICSVPQCSSYCVNGISLHQFPWEPKLREKWRQTLKIGKAISTYMLVCSKHFRTEDFFYETEHTKCRRLKKGTMPSQNLPRNVPQPKIKPKQPEIAEKVILFSQEDLLASDEYEKLLRVSCKDKDEFGTNKGSAVQYLSPGKKKLTWCKEEKSKKTKTQMSSEYDKLLKVKYEEEFETENNNLIRPLVRKRRSDRSKKKTSYKDEFKNGNNNLILPIVRKREPGRTRKKASYESKEQFETKNSKSVRSSVSKTKRPGQNEEFEIKNVNSVRRGRSAQYKEVKPKQEQLQISDEYYKIFYEPCERTEAFETNSSVLSPVLSPDINKKPDWPRKKTSYESREQFETKNNKSIRSSVSKTKRPGRNEEFEIKNVISARRGRSAQYKEVKPEQEQLQISDEYYKILDEPCKRTEAFETNSSVLSPDINEKPDWYKEVKPKQEQLQISDEYYKIFYEPCERTEAFETNSSVLSPVLSPDINKKPDWPRKKTPYESRDQFETKNSKSVRSSVSKTKRTGRNKEFEIKNVNSARRGRSAQHKEVKSKQEQLQISDGYYKILGEPCKRTEAFETNSSVLSPDINKKPDWYKVVKPKQEQLEISDDYYKILYEPCKRTEAFETNSSVLSPDINKKPDWYKEVKPQQEQLQISDGYYKMLYEPCKRTEAFETNSSVLSPGINNKPDWYVEFVDKSTQTVSFKVKPFIDSKYTDISTQTTSDVEQLKN